MVGKYSLPGTSHKKKIAGSHKKTFPSRPAINHEKFFLHLKDQASGLQQMQLQHSTLLRLIHEGTCQKPQPENEKEITQL